MKRALSLYFRTHVTRTSTYWYFQMQHELADAVEEQEEELDSRARQYEELQHELHDMLQLMTQETSDIQQLERDLKDGTSPTLNIHV